MRIDSEHVMSKDPVCGMTVDEKTAAGRSDYQGKTYYFCAPICKRKFDEDPAKYAARTITSER
jgi:YHS domain-containing protein